MRLYKVFIFTIFIVSLFGFHSCQKDKYAIIDTGVGGNPFNEENDKIEKSVSLSEDEFTLELGDTLVLTPTFGDGQAPLKYYSWNVENKNVAQIVSVDKDNYKVSIIGLNEGVTTITLYSDDRQIKAACTLIVDDPFDDGIVRILMIGNDTPSDSVEQYLWDMAKAAGKNVIIGNLYLEDASLADHWDNASGNNAAYDFRLIDKDGNKTNTANTSIEDVLASDGWGYISFQQNNSDAGKSDTYTTPFPLLYDYVAERAQNFKVKFLLHQPWAYQQGTTPPGFGNYNNDQTTMYDAIVNAVSDAAGLKPVDIVVPGGTAVQNGRATYFGDIFTKSDGEHLNALGQYTVACAWFESIFGENAVGNSFKPAELDTRQVEVAQHVAHAAIVAPKAVTVLEDYKPVRGIQSSPVLISFGAESIGNGWNAFIGFDASAGRRIDDLQDVSNQRTGIPIEIIKEFNDRNGNGALGVTVFGVPLPNEIASFSYYGNAEGLWLGKSITESKLKISRLDRNLKYNFCFYGSRNGVGDNRETKYICEGANVVTAALNTANNTSTTACAEEVQPDINGDVIITVTAGEHNNNGSKFYYLGVMQISRSN